MVDKELALTVSPSPHLRSPMTVPQAMRDVLIALLPVTLVSIYWFKFAAVFLIIVCLATAVLTELLFRKILRKPPSLHDGSALVTGLLVALLFGPGTAWWTAILCTFIGIGLAKELMGGLGWNRFNPALFGRLAVILIYPLFHNIAMGFAPLRLKFTVDLLTQATPLALLKQGSGLPALSDLFIAYPGGALGETSVLALLIGGAYLLYKKHITWHTPVSIMGAVVVMALLFGQPPLYHLFAGGVMIGSIFMATDWVTSPITTKGKVIFGLAIGVLLMVFRVALGPTEGMAFSIVIMNGFVPFIDRATKRLKFGELRETRPAGPGLSRPAVSKSK